MTHGFSGPEKARSAGAFRLIVTGAVLAAALGTGAGAALRPEPAEQGRAAAPQQLLMSGSELASAEQAGGGWPDRAPTTRSRDA